MKYVLHSKTLIVRLCLYGTCKVKVFSNNDITVSSNNVR